MAIASGVMQAGGQIMGGMQANEQSKYDASLAKQNAALEVESAHDSVLAGQDERLDFWRKVGAARSQNIAAMAANGIEVDYGAGARLQSDTDMLAAEDAKRLYKNIEQRTRGHHINANNFAREAKAARARGKAAVVQSVFGAATSLLGAASQASAFKAKMAPANG